VIEEIMAEHPAEQQGRGDPASGRSHRRIRVGVVASAKGDKTIRVRVAALTRHTRYGKYMRKRTVLHAHDEGNVAAAGDRVEIAECRPYSKLKHWRLVRVLGKLGHSSVESE
jgi:small subunit ribosomal protein S17